MYVVQCLLEAKKYGIKVSLCPRAFFRIMIAFVEFFIGLQCSCFIGGVNQSMDMIRMMDFM